MKYCVDVPTMNGDWDEVAVFDTRADATEFVRLQWGGDENGMIALITECDLDEDEPTGWEEG